MWNGKWVCQSHQPSHEVSGGSQIQTYPYPQNFRASHSYRSSDKRRNQEASEVPELPRSLSASDAKQDLELLMLRSLTPFAWAFSQPVLIIYRFLLIFCLCNPSINFLEDWFYNTVRSICLSYFWINIIQWLKIYLLRFICNFTLYLSDILESSGYI